MLTPTPITLSADALKTWERCPQQFAWKHLDRLQWPADHSNFVLGTRVHKLMDYHARNLDVDALLPHQPPDVVATWRTLLAHPAAQWPVVASEWGFELPVGLLAEQPYSNGPIWVTGRIDRVAWHQNQLWIIDWKTGTAAPKHAELAWQTGVYALAVAHAWQSLPQGPWQQQPPQTLTMAYVSASTTHSHMHTVVLNAQTLAQWQTRLTQACQALTSATQYPPATPCPDKWCPFRSICPAVCDPVRYAN
jgi:RecB family exonuclease